MGVFIPGEDNENINFLFCKKLLGFRVMILFTVNSDVSHCKL